MKATALLLLLSLPLTVYSAPRDDLRQNQRTRSAAMEQFRAGSAESALTQLRQGLKPEPIAGGDQSALPQSLIDIAGDFYNRREMRLAREATLQAHRAAEPVLAGRTAVTAPRRAHLYASLGVLYESVLFDMKTALACYDAALALQPSDSVSRSRRNLARERLQRRNGGAR